ncbi:MAG: hypothetical protein ABIJ45_15090 [Candidatus Zixiibacteriota bacterium]
MKKLGRLTAVVVCLCFLAANLVWSGCSAEIDDTGKSSPESLISEFYKKKAVRILVTDSGLGGLSVAAEIEKRMESSGLFQNVDIIFGNALPSSNYLYNQMPSKEEKVTVFSAALTGMQSTFKPDIILIACNTLSVIYPETEFSRTTNIPVIDIVDFGVNLIKNELEADPDNNIVILGTPTTISQNSHREALGPDSIRVIPQACDMLESEIQSDPNSDIVQTMIEMYGWEAAGKFILGSNDSLAVALCCTHYPYSSKLFKTQFEQIFDKSIKILDPNQEMSRFLFKPELENRYDHTVVGVKVVSQAELSSEAINSISNIIRPISLKTADALKNYELNKDLFRF